MEFLHCQVTADRNDIIETRLDSQANVSVMDEYNFQRYRRGESHRYFGGLIKATPYRVSPPHYGTWHVAIDLGGYSGTVRASVSVLRGK